MYLKPWGLDGRTQNKQAYPKHIQIILHTHRIYSVQLKTIQFNEFLLCSFLFKAKAVLEKMLHNIF